LPFTNGGKASRYSVGGSESCKYPEVVVWKFARQARRQDESTSDGNGKCALCLLTAAGAAYAQDAQQTPCAQMSQSAEQQGAAPTEEQVRDTSVSGMRMSRTQTGGRTLYGAPCIAGRSAIFITEINRAAVPGADEKEVTR
jgi:hypothetical protein